ncbi:ATP-binding cassette domain-containing protein [Mobilitalea sibirica]|uniref:ATP-binding cassette domain-containing protein n=1 Tax=Mobilitalea sibirica TaxID=1462919 RepID=A0A8J7KZN6_9FIRM|nr:ATP-binding cassette domain-containing protein [Mobilitalea sibirica]MBH1940593.1 ATP-binding cassette domain-containing protein [Mobilitalea sibirica]
MESMIISTKDLSFNDIIHYQDVGIIKNQVNFIVGSSGTGKSTLLRLFNGTYSPSQGNVFYEGQDLNEIDTIELRKEILLISQSLYLFDLSIRDNFIQFYEYRGLDAPSEQEMRRFLDLCCIPFPLEQDCTTMSGGERQRIYIAIFLSFHPKVLMMDEPTSALDKENSQNVIHNVLSYCKENNITVIIVSHDPNITEQFAEHVITIKRRESQ